MTETTNTAGAITKAVKAAPSKETTLKDYVKAYEKEFAKALPSVITPERFTRIATTALTRTPELMRCTPQSFIGALLTAAQLGLEPNTPLGQAYLIPYGTECQFQIGYKGLIELAHRSGQLKTIEAHIVYENDEFEFEFGLEPKLKHKPSMGERGNIVWAYACYHLVNGGYGFEVMSKHDLEEHRKNYSKVKGKSPWETATEEMYKKTVIKKALKYAPIKSEFADALYKDGKSIRLDVENNETEAQADFIIDADTGEIIED
ncbi:MAG: recombinase RecT [Candidatus Ornithomonoglobus sp.]